MRDPRWEAYVRLQPSLLRVLGGLARQGFAVPPDDGVDLIIDFFLEEWPEVVRTHDAGRGEIDPYARIAFRRFCRRAIQRVWRRRAMLEDAALVAELVTRAPMTIDPWVATAARQVRDALGRLTPFRREILVEYLSTPDHSERRLAAQYQMSRHRLRESLADALGGLAVELGGSAFASTPDGAVARELWSNGHSPKSAAAVLRMSTVEVQAARRRVAAAIAEGLRGRGQVKAEPNVDDEPPTVSGDSRSESYDRPEQ